VFTLDEPLSFGQLICLIIVVAIGISMVISAMRGD